MNRVYNFGAGPAALPYELLTAARDEFLDWNNLGLSVLEVGHRTEAFTTLLTHAEQTLRMLIGIPSNYHVLFLGGAARTQFAMIPMNFLHPEQHAGYLVSGLWSKMALDECQRLKNGYCIATTQVMNFTTIPDQEALDVHEDSAYVYYTPNETINGVRIPYTPKVKDIPLIADMTSCLLSEPIDVSKYDLIFAGAQKNIANAGLTLVIINNKLVLKTPSPVVPTMFDYKLQIENLSLYATPPVFNCYLAAKMFDWVDAQGGVDVLYRENCRKAAMLYQYIDSTEFYTVKVHPTARSIMNVCFSLNNESLETIFLEKAMRRGLYALKGHRLTGGIRASIYNAMPIQGVEALVDFMQEFVKDQRL